MAKGVVGQYFYPGMTVNQVLQGAWAALQASGFSIRHHSADYRTGRIKAIWGSKLKAWLVGHLPFGKLIKAGKRLGAEVEAVEANAGTTLRLIVVPYMELFDRPEIFLLSQGIMEKLTDDSFAREKFEEITARLASSGLRPAMPGAWSPPTVAPPVMERGIASGPYYQPPLPTRPPSRPRGTGLTTFLGLLVGLGLTYYVMTGRIRINDPNVELALLLAGIPMLSGLLSRRIGGGALNGFLSLFLPLIVLAVWVLNGTGSAADAIGPFGVFSGTLVGVLLIALAFGFGFVGLVFGALGGGIGRALFRAHPRASQ